MLIPPRCWSCGKPIGHLWEAYTEESAKDDKGNVLTSLGLKRYCCRQMFLGHVDLVDTVAMFKKF
ncbi:DNA-directed RNA polymerase subunit N [Candidatus Woesearchaeota archaeon]|nr:DNA-directed RNA polymerase subunit N [Candidatus Woesearchaeota archaeon]